MSLKPHNLDESNFTIQLVNNYYIADQPHNFIVIEDKKFSETVANFAVKLVEITADFLKSKNLNIDDYKIIYKDTIGNKGGLIKRAREYRTFLPILVGTMVAANDNSSE